MFQVDDLIEFQWKNYKVNQVIFGNEPNAKT